MLVGHGPRWAVDMKSPRLGVSVMISKRGLEITPDLTQSHNLVTQRHNKSH